MQAKLIKDHDNYHLVNDEQFVIGTTDESILSCSDKYKLSLKNCQAIERGYDLDELAKKACPDVISSANSAYKAGFQKALEILSDKKFTYNQMVSAITESSISHRLPSLIIQDLQQTEWDVVVKMRPASLVYLSNLVIEELDADGCLILKRK